MGIKHKKFLQRAALAAAFMLSVSASAEPQRGGTLNFLIEQEPTALVGIATTAGVTQRIGAKVTEGLLTYDFNLDPLPQLATAWSVSDDGLRYTFTLRDGVQWHDGKPFTSADVAYSVLLLKAHHPRGRTTFAHVTEVQTPDPHTVVLLLSQPAPYLLTALDATAVPIVPRHVYDGSDPLRNPNNTAPIGTGPFVFKEWVRGSHIIYERNPNYWDAPKPWLDRIVARFNTDANAGAAAFETGEIHLTASPPLVISDIDRLAKLPGVTTEVRGDEYNASQTQLFFNFETPILQDRQVRLAIAHAIDLKAIQKLVWFGYGEISPTPISPAIKRYHDGSIKPYAFDVALANTLLDEAGHARGANGQRFALRLIYNPYNDRRLADYLKQALSRVGINVTIAAYDFGTYIQRAYTQRDFDLTAEWLSNTFDPTVGVQRVYWSKNFKIGLPFSNPGHYVNAEVDRLLEAGAVENDPARRVAIFKEFQRVVRDDVAAVNLIAPQRVTLAHPKIKGHTVGATGLANNFANLYIEQ